MMRQHDRDHQRPVTAEESIWTVLPVALIVVLLIGVLTMGLLRSFNFGPSLGDVVVFQPSHLSVSADGLAGADVTVRRAGTAGSDAASCVLNPPTMAAEGGSLVVERALSATPPLYQVHWAGRRTSTGSDDCGASADLLLPAADLLDLAGAAGGFGVSRKAVTSGMAANAVPTIID
jgi:hypothetical protein